MAATRDKTGQSMFGNSEVQETPDGAGDASVYNRDLSGQRRSSKSATYPWSADQPLKAKSVKRSGSKPID